MKYSFPNPNDNEWIRKYNELVDEVAKNEDFYKKYKKTQPKRDDKDPNSWTADSVGIHHIIPKKINPDIQKDKENLLYVTTKDHCWLHYYLWRADKKYAKHFWFLLQAARKRGWWELPEGDSEYEEIKKDLKIK